MTLWTPPPSPLLPPAFGPDPALLHRLTRDLTPTQARHLAILTPQGITANSAALAGALRFHRFPLHAVTGAPVQAADDGGLSGLLGGLVRAFTPGKDDTAGKKGVDVHCRDEKSGPYRRVYSKPGYAYQHSTVYLPSDVLGEMKEEKEAGHGDTAFIYAGGWGGKGGAVDAGFQHGRYMGRPQDDWAPFFLVQQMGGPSAITVSDEKQAGGAPWRLLAGQEAQLTFWVTQDADLTVLSMSIQGETSVDRAPASLTLRAPIDARFGWSAEGGANILKRMTTIGQKYGQQNLSTGSYMKAVRWQGSRIGTAEADAGAWVAEQTGGYCTFPSKEAGAAAESLRSDGQGAKWSIQFQDAGNETASIFLK